MKVGDLVECTTLHGICKSGRYGIIVKDIPDFTPTKKRYFVLLNGRSRPWPFLANQLKLISKIEYENENGNSK